MEKNRLNYYYIEDKGIIAKGYYLSNLIYDFDSQTWKKDENYIISDRLMGYDPGEPSGSPYGIGSTSEMEGLQRITYEKAMQMIGDRTVEHIIQALKETFQERKQKWDQNPGESAKDVEVSFFLFGTQYVLGTTDFGYQNTNCNQGLLKAFRKTIEIELRFAGADGITFYEKSISKEDCIMEEMTKTQAYAELLALRKLVEKAPKETVLEILDEKLKAYEDFEKTTENCN